MTVIQAMSDLVESVRHAADWAGGETIGQMLAALPADHPSHQHAAKFWRCRCGGTGGVLDVDWTVIDGAAATVCPHCDGENTLSMIEDAS